jgi:hypothetical protein
MAQLKHVAIRAKDARSPVLLCGVREPCSRFDWAKPCFAPALSQAMGGTTKAPAWLAHSKD